MNTAGEPRCTPRILAVEDDPAIRRFYDRFLRSHGYDLVLAADGTIALELLQAGEDFDVLLLDVRLPGVSGRALWRWLELERPELCDRVLFVTGDILGENTQQLLREVGRPSIEKPFSAQTLLEKIQETLDDDGGISNLECRM